MATGRPRRSNAGRLIKISSSVSITTTFKEQLAKLGIIFCSFSDAVQNHPDLVYKYLGSVVPPSDNFFAALNSAVFSDGSFCYVPRGVRCPMELSTYFRINTPGTGQFERTLIVAEEGSYVSYLEGCTAPMRAEHQLHAAVVELVALDNAQIKYSTIQNWYPGDAQGRGGIFNFVTKRGKCQGVNSKISWTQVETGAAITWKYPSVLLLGDNSIGEFYSVALTANWQQADTGTKMIHSGRHTRSTILAKGISAGHGQNSYRGLVKILKGATGSRNYSQCDSLLLSDTCAMLEIRKLHVTVEGKEVLRGVDLTVRAGEVHAIMGPNASGKSTLAQALAGRDVYTVTAGEVLYEGLNLLAMTPEDRAREGLFMAFQYPVEIPGISNREFLRAAVNAIRKHRGLDNLKIPEFLALARQRIKQLGIDEELLKRSVNEGFSGGEKKRNEIFQLAVLEPRLAILDETDSGLDIDALRIVADGVNSLRSSERAIIVVTHYQRLLNYVVPDCVHVLVEGRIVRSGGKELALELEEQGNQDR